jgi:hypothetical protein
VSAAIWGEPPHADPHDRLGDVSIRLGDLAGRTTPPQPREHGIDIRRVYTVTPGGHRYDVAPDPGPTDGPCIAGWGDCHCAAGRTA